MKKYRFMIYFLLVISFVGCSGSGGMVSDGANTPSTSAYILSTSTAGTISPEYKTYNFVVKDNIYEKRKIIVKGRIDNKQDNAGNIINDIRSIWDGEDCFTSSPVYSNPGKGSEDYYNSDTNEFVVSFPYQCWKNYDYTLTLVGGRDNCISAEKRVCSSSANVHIVQDRKMKIHYNYMKSYDILYNASVGYDALNSIKNAFADANTGIEVINENKGEVADATLQLNQISWDQDLYDELVSKKLIPSGNLMPDGTTTPNASVWLIGLKSSSTVSQVNAPAGGYTLRTTNSTGKLLAVSCVFVETAKMKYPNDTEKQKKFVTVVTCHELGHGRAIELTPDQTKFFTLDNFNGLTYGNLTDDAHTGGHNGNNKDTCIMSYGITDAQIEKIHFCSGHLQMLFNCSSQDGGY